MTKTQKSNILPQWMQQPNTQLGILFLICFTLLSWYYGYFEIFHNAPYASHSWRQTDSTSFIQNYYNDGMHFFQTRVHHVVGGESLAAPSEFPILYFLTAGIWKIFGPHDGVLRLIDLFLFFLGCFALSKLTLKLTQDVFYALFVPLLLMGSPVIGYYAFTYIPNSPALGLTFTGVYCFYNFVSKENRNWLFAAWGFFLFAGLLKVTVLVPYVVIILVFLWEKLGLGTFKKTGKIFKKGWVNLPFLLSVFFIIGGWIAWVKYYNHLHNCHIFITKTRPIWSLVEPAITQTWHWIIKDGAPQYYNRLTRYFVFGTLFVLLFFLRRKQPKLLYFFNLFTFLGCVGIFVIFYRQFFIHDYYAIEMMVFPAATFVTLSYVLTQSFPKVGKHFVTRLVLFGFLLFNLHYTQQGIQKRLAENKIFDQQYDVSTYNKHAAQAFLRELGLNYEEKVIAIPDVSPNFNLNYFNLRGWTEFALNPQPFKPEVFDAFIDFGAEYLIITDKEYLKHERVISFLDYPLGNFQNTIFVFDLRAYKKKK